MSLKTVLIVDDDALIRQVWRENLQNNDFIVFEAAAGKRMMEIVCEYNIDIILLDLNLLDGSGFDFLPDIRERTGAPVIIVSGIKDKACKIRAFRSGADDYIQKPIDVDELLAKIDAYIRRYRGDYSPPGGGGGIESRESEKIYVGPWFFDRARFQIFDRNNASANLTLKEFQLLERLVVSTPKVVTREELCEAIREKNYIPTNRAIDVKITRIRKKIGDDASSPSIIKTVRGIGYALDGKVVV